MIARHWRGWTTVQNADDYERFLKEKVLPGLKEIEGYRGGYLLRSDGGDEAEFVVVNFFDSLDAVKRFAGSGVRTRGKASAVQGGTGGEALRGAGEHGVGSCRMKEIAHLNKRGQDGALTACF